MCWVAFEWLLLALPLNQFNPLYDCFQRPYLQNEELKGISYPLLVYPCWSTLSSRESALNSLSSESHQLCGRSFFKKGNDTKDNLEIPCFRQHLSVSGSTPCRRLGPDVGLARIGIKGKYLRVRMTIRC